MTNHQEKAGMLVTQFNLETRPHIRLLDIQAELGELAKEYLILTDYGHKDFQTNENWELELGDIYFSLLCLANTTGVGLEEALQKVVVKYQKRFNSAGTIGSPESILE
jgi:NTP pyrophosphatase (non-canonical NTP hydrolase)